MESRRRPDCQLFHRGVQGNTKRQEWGYRKIENRTKKQKKPKKEQILVSAAVAARTLLMDSQGKEP